MKRQITVALDAMGGDFGIKVVLPAAVHVLKRYPHLTLILVGDQKLLCDALPHYGVRESQRLRIRHASQVIAMGELPSQALRHKKDSSMRVAIDLVKNDVADACVSAGNTGALMATAHFVLKTLPGIERAAITGLIPARNKYRRVWMLDLGANVDSTAEQLVQFAMMGSVLASAVDQIERPKVALLNIGEESIKGNEQVKETAALLSAHPEINYIGFIEGDGIFKGQADVVVCDGFIGNVVLKSMEGVAEFISRIMKEAFYKNWLTKLAGLGAGFVLKSLMKRMDPSRYNGATFLGLRGIVVKSHGGANIAGFEKAIEKAIVESEHRVSTLIQNRMVQLLNRSKHKGQ